MGTNSVGSGGTAVTTIFADNVNFSGGKDPTISTDGQLLIGSTAAPHIKVGTLTSTDGSIVITNGSGTIDLSTDSNVPWVHVTSGPQAMAIDTGYVCDTASLIVFTLPTSATYGDIVEIITHPAGGTWKITYGTGQFIIFTGDATTTTTGSLQGLTGGSAIGLRCVTPSITAPIFEVVYATGQIVVDGGPATLNIIGTGPVLQIANNLNDVASASASRANLGITNIATQSVTQHDVIVGGAANALTSVSPSTSGFVLSSLGVGSDPAFAALGVNSGLTTHGVLLGENNSAIVATTAGTNGQVLIGTSGADPTFVTPTAGTGLAITTNATTLEYALSTPVTVPNGGTGQTTLTSHGVLVGAGTAAITQLAVGADHSILVGNTGADPTFTTTGTPYVTGISFDAGTNTLSNYVNSGTFTPTLVGASTAGTTTYSAQNGNYIRVGNLVLVNFQVAVTATTGTGNALFGGLPFTIRNTTVNFVGSLTINSTAWAWPTSTTTAVFIGLVNTTTGTVRTYANGIGNADLQMTNGVASFTVSLMYSI